MNELYKKRGEICNKCPELKVNKIFGKTCGDIGKPTKFSDGRSKTCGCVLYLKARIPAASCPQNKW